MAIHMNELAQQILEVIEDYQRDTGTQINRDRVLTWARQFDQNDQEFLLVEFLHLLGKGIYLSKQGAIESLERRLEQLRAQLGYATIPDLLDETVFLNLQANEKSQREILALLDQILQLQFNRTVAGCGGQSQRNFIYFDDAMNTGKTIFRQTLAWLKELDASGVERYVKVNKRTIRLVISVFCHHSLAWANLRWQYKLKLNNDEIMNRVTLISDYVIENHIRFPDQRLNLVYPYRDQPGDINAYLQGLQATAYEDRAYRGPNQPLTETFFSSRENRLRFESILLKKGIGILQRVAHLGPQHRPLGDTYPHYKTFGTGTMYFTWRNISNTCPLVFWWDNPAHGWRSLFPLRNRGGN
jgi:hypothetical protein